MLVFNILRRFVWSLQSTDCAGRALACLFPFSAHMLPLNGVPATPFGHEHALKRKILRQVALLRRVQPPGEKCGLKLSGGQRDRMRAGRPRSQAMTSRRCGGGCLAGDFSESRRAPFGKLPFAREPGPATPSGSFEEKRPIVNPKFLTHRQDNSFIFNHHSGISGCVAWEHPDELEGPLLKRGRLGQSLDARGVRFRGQSALVAGPGPQVRHQRLQAMQR